MNTKRLISIITIISSLSLFATTADAQPGRTVDCDRGDSIQAAIDKQVGHTGPIEIFINGTCNENVVISRDSIHLTSNSNAVLSGEILIDGAKRITLSSFQVTGPGNGVIGNNNSDVDLRDMVITGNQGLMGVGSNVGSYVEVYDSTISNNQNWGLNVTNGATLGVDHTDVINNTNINIRADANSSLYILNGSTISGSTGDGIHVILNSSAWLQDTAITGNTSTGIFVQYDGSVRFNHNVTVSGNGGAGIDCQDTESSFINLGASLADSVNCTDFNQ